MEHDMRMPFWINYFDAAFNLFTSFGYFASDREHHQAFSSIIKSIKHGGIFVIDYFNANVVLQKLEPKTIKHINDSSYTITKWIEGNRLFKKIEVENPALAAPMQYTERVALFNLQDFTKMLAKNNVDVIDVFGNYSLAPFEDDISTRMVIVGRKR
jgi:SAM-dependent methyltransferase